jgi:Domain of unknown function (DUF5666)
MNTISSKSTMTTLANSAMPVTLSRRHFTFGAASSLLLTACGGGGGDFAGVSTGGTGSFAASSFASGTIRGFGSIIVNGVRYDDSRANITGDDGQTVSSTSLKLGMVVDVNGSAVTTDAAGQQLATATSIGFRSEIKGAVTAIDTVANVITLLGQRIQINAATVFDDSLVGGLTAIRVNDVIEVYGLPVSPGVYQATRVERSDAATQTFKLRGMVSNLNTTASTFSLGAVVVNYSALVASAPALQNGERVRVNLSVTKNASGQYVATRLVSSSTLGSVATTSNVSLEIEGYVSTFTSATNFVVNGVQVDARSAEKIAAGIALGSAVEVSGTLQAGILVAREVKLESESDMEGVELRGVMSALNSASTTFVVRGVTVNYATAEFKKGSVAGLANGRSIEVEGKQAANGSLVIATEIKIED